MRPTRDDIQPDAEEIVLWKGRPANGFVIRSYDYLTRPFFFAATLAVPPAFWWMLWPSARQFPSVLWVALAVWFTGAPLVLWALAFVYEPWVRRRTEYVVTNRRAYLHRPFPLRPVVSVPAGTPVRIEQEPHWRASFWLGARDEMLFRTEFYSPLT